jgi:ActR/RegA family two-component response regulator
MRRGARSAWFAISSMAYSILVVDDEELTLRTISRGLREEGFEVSTATSGEQRYTSSTMRNPTCRCSTLCCQGWTEWKSCGR